MHSFRIAWLEAHGRSGGNIEAHAVGCGAVELQGGIGFDEVIMAADLDGSVAEIGDGERDDGAAIIERDFGIRNFQCAGDYISVRCSGPYSKDGKVGNG